MPFGCLEGRTTAYRRSQARKVASGRPAGELGGLVDLRTSDRPRRQPWGTGCDGSCHDHRWPIPYRTARYTSPPEKIPRRLSLRPRQSSPHATAPTERSTPCRWSHSPRRAPRVSASLTLDPWVSINTIRVLAMDAVEQAQSGHPGTPMALAPAAYVLFRRHLKHAAHAPHWPDRDRFVLSCGHASMLLYSMLHLSGYDLSLDDIKQFRQWGSKTPGHPERGHTAGVETTTGPLGQGIGNAVGMAIAERLLAAQYNRPGLEIVNHRTWVFASDGDMMEGVASEASSLAGHLQLGKLTVVYDDNRITIDGPTDISFSDDVGKRYEAYGWRVLHVDDGNDVDAIDAALADAGSQSERPTLIVLRTIIADPAPTKRNTSEAHGAPLGKDEIAKTKAILGWPGILSRGPRGVHRIAATDCRGRQARGRVESAAGTPP